VQDEDLWRPARYRREDKAANHQKVGKLLEIAPPKRGRLLILPEMLIRIYNGSRKVSDEKNRHDTKIPLRSRREFGVYVVGGLVTAIPDPAKNEAAVFDPHGQRNRSLPENSPIHPRRRSTCLFGRERDQTFRWGDFTVVLSSARLRFPNFPAWRSNAGQICSWSSPTGPSPEKATGYVA